MFKVFLFLFISTIIPTENPYGSSIQKSDYKSMKWPYVEKTFEAGEVQSPVNILSCDAYKASLSNLLYFRYWREQSVKINMKNDGHTLHIHSITFPDYNFKAHITGGPLFEKEYIFSHIDIRWGTEGEEGSEHQINSQSYPIEVQMVHYKNEYEHYKKALYHNDGVCIVSYFGKLSDQDNPKMNDFIIALQSIQKPVIAFLSTFDFQFHWLLEIAENYSYYAYPGSLTVYPFTQCVTWIIYKNTFEISKEQLAVFRTLGGAEDNFLTSVGRRILQPFNSRPLCYV